MLLVHDYSHCSASLAIHCVLITVVLQHQRINTLHSHNVYSMTLNELNQSYFNVVPIDFFFFARFEVLIVLLLRIKVICNGMLCYWINSSQCLKDNSAFYLHGVSHITGSEGSKRQCGWWANRGGRDMHRMGPWYMSWEGEISLNLNYIKNIRRKLH